MRPILRARSPASSDHAPALGAISRAPAHWRDAPGTWRDPAPCRRRTPSSGPWHRPRRTPWSPGAGGHDEHGLPRLDVDELHLGLGPRGAATVEAHEDTSGLGAFS